MRTNSKGSSLAVPALVYAAGQTTSDATTTSLLVVAGASAFGLIKTTDGSTIDAFLEKPLRKSHCGTMTDHDITLHLTETETSFPCPALSRLPCEHLDGSP